LGALTFCYRKADVNLPAKKLVPAHVIPATTAVADVTTAPGDKMTTTSPAASADNVASVAVAAVLASQTYMKVSASVCFMCFTYFLTAVAVVVYMV